MTLQTIVDSPRIFIGRDTQNSWLYVDLRGTYDTEKAHEVCALMLESLLQWPCDKILSDGTNVDHITIQHTIWGAQWVAEMRSAGLRFMAWVLPHDLLARQVTEARVGAIDDPRVGTFDDVESAYSWLQQQH